MSGVRRVHFAQMVLGDYLDGEMILENVDVGIGAHGLDEALLDFESGVVGVMEYAEFGMSTFAVQVESSVGAFVEVDTPFHKLAYLCGGFRHHLAHGFRVAEIVAGHHCVVDMFFKVVDFKVGH